MIDYPKKYMSEQTERFAKKQDYKNLLNRFRGFYEELFEFENIEKRIDLYHIKHDLEDLIWWPDTKELKENIKKIINYE